MSGRFTDGHGVFLGRDTLAGAPVDVRFDWHVTSANAARWAQAFSLDSGRTWTTNWLMELTREPQNHPPSAAPARESE